jgi:hypothetical protein
LRNGGIVIATSSAMQHEIAGNFRKKWRISAAQQRIWLVGKRQRTYVGDKRIENALQDQSSGNGRVD